MTGIENWVSMKLFTLFFVKRDLTIFEMKFEMNFEMKFKMNFEINHKNFVFVFKQILEKI